LASYASRREPRTAQRSGWRARVSSRARRQQGSRSRCGRGRGAAVSGAVATPNQQSGLRLGRRAHLCSNMALRRGASTSRSLLRAFPVRALSTPLPRPDPCAPPPSPPNRHPAAAAGLVVPLRGRPLGLRARGAVTPQRAAGAAPCAVRARAAAARRGVRAAAEPAASAAAVGGGGCFLRGISTGVRRWFWRGADIVCRLAQTHAGQTVRRAWRQLHRTRSRRPAPEGSSPHRSARRPGSHSGSSSGRRRRRRSAAAA
jgi:hypothetical protein